MLPEWDEEAFVLGRFEQQAAIARTGRRQAKEALAAGDHGRVSQCSLAAQEAQERADALERDLASLRAARNA